MASELLARLIVGVLAWFVAPGQSQPLPTRPPGTTTTPTTLVSPEPSPSVSLTTLTPQAETVTEPASTPTPQSSPPEFDSAGEGAPESNAAETSLEAQASRDLIQAEIRAIRLELLQLVERLAFLEAQLASNTISTPAATPEPAPEPEPQAPPATATPTPPETAEREPESTLPPTTLILGTQTISLPGDVLFDFNSTELRPEARALLRRVVNSIQESMPEGHINVAGHTDNIGSAAYNLGLSLERANVVKDYLRSILRDEATRYSWTAVGYGMSQPVASNDNETGRQSNRRVDLVVRPASDNLD